MNKTYTFHAGIDSRKITVAFRKFFPVHQLQDRADPCLIDVAESLVQSFRMSGRQTIHFFGTIGQISHTAVIDLGRLSFHRHRQNIRIFLHPFGDRRNAEALILNEANWISGELQRGRTAFSREDLACGTDGGLLLIEDDTIMLSGKDALEKRLLSEICPGYEEIRSGVITLLNIDSISCMGLIEKVGYTLVLLFIPESEIYLGSMQAAREVGGDFYDYFLIGEGRLGIVIADVSGKGVPAALFMMTAKTLIKNLVLSGNSPAEALQSANSQLCENNDRGMFVTAWLGILDLKTCRLEFANAGHNAPLLKQSGETFRYMDYKSYRRGFVLGGFPETRYQDNAIVLEQNALLFLYTDGVTEAVNPDLELYGEERLQKCMEACWQMEPEALLRAVRQDIDAFAAGEEQADDITMVVLKKSQE